MRRIIPVFLVFVALSSIYMSAPERPASVVNTVNTPNSQNAVLPAVVPGKIPSTWRGFNLLNMFYLGDGTDKAFTEAEFKMMSEWGFNFVRIPIDYRIIVRSNNWNNIDERAVSRIDKAIEYGMAYNIHVCLNLHRAPGYTVAEPKEASDLWTQREPQEAFARMWGYLAQRYKDIPNDNLSFNFVNEPSGVDEAVYAEVIKKAADAIRAHSPSRLLIADGIEYGTKPSRRIKELGIAQATRGYQPFTLTHYKADWVEGSQNYNLPAWPSYMLPKYLYAIGKNDVPRSIYSIEHDFNSAYNLDVNVGVVSGEARLIVKADGKIIYERLFQSGAGRGEWKTVVYREEWNVYQNIFDRDYRIEIPAGTKLLTLEVTDGDWMTVNDMKFSPASGASSRRGASGNTVSGERAFSVTPTSADWGVRIPRVKINAAGELTAEGAAVNRAWLWETYYKPWEEYIKNGEVLVGEWGSHNKTPHDVVLRWMEDSLQLYKANNMSWALWNFTDSFGILNSGRTDVRYENYQGYRLDREMLNLLLKYM